MKRTITLMLLAATLAIASIASAHTSTPRVDRREARQQARIGQGVKSGELTPRETRRVEGGQIHVQKMERRAKADGHVTPRERARLNRAQNHQSRRIHRLKHNERSS